jgi:hypothetical protein
MLAGVTSFVVALGFNLTATGARSYAHLARTNRLMKPALSTSQTDWLGEIDRYREAAGLTPVTDEPAWDVGIEHHLTYLEKTPAFYETDKYASAHTENPASPYYTTDGALEAESSDLALGDVTNPVDGIDGWLAAPFHAIGMLRPDLQRVAFASDAQGYAGLDVIQGLTGTATQTNPVLFPGPGVTTDLMVENGGEVPSPLQTCHWSGTAGLPLIVLLPAAPSPGATATLAGPKADESSSGGTLCIVDQYDYYSSDAVYGPTGLDLLEGDHAVFLIPRRPLTQGTYSASLYEPEQAPITWSFNATVPVPVAGTRPSIEGHDQNGETLEVQHAEWSNNPIALHEQWMRCRRGGCAAVRGATGTTYHLGRADIGAELRVVETARNAGGLSTPSWSRSTPGVQSKPRS